MMPDREKVISGLHCRAQDLMIDLPACDKCDYQVQIVNRMGCDFRRLCKDALTLLKEQEAVVHPEPSCEMTYITDCCCDLCGVQLIREDNFCRCCGKRIEWEGR